MASLGEELSLSSVVESLLDMRTYRMGLIQTEDQLRFSVEAIVQGVKKVGLEQEEKKQKNGKRVAEEEAGDCTDTNNVAAKKRKHSES